MSLEHSPERHGADGRFDDLRLPEFCRYSDLVALGLFRSRMTLDRAIKRGAFPTGRMLPGGNTRIWTRPEIKEALAQCSIEKLPRVTRSGSATEAAA